MTKRRNTLHNMIMREAAVCSRMKPKDQAMTDEKQKPLDLEAAEKHALDLRCRGIAYRSDIDIAQYIEAMVAEIERLRALVLAAGPWIKMGKPPADGRPYLIHANYAGIETQDVAFYHGRRPDGSHWWVTGDVEIEAAHIEYYAEITPPEKDSGDAIMARAKETDNVG